LKKIIVTVSADDGSFSKDIEIPLSVSMGLVSKKIIDNLSILYPEFPFFRKKWCLMNRRTGMRIAPDHTAEDNGIWNGDIISLSEV